MVADQRGVPVTEEVAGKYRARSGPMTIARYTLGAGYVLVAILNFREGEHPRAAWAWLGMSVMWCAIAFLLSRAQTILDPMGVHTRDVGRWRHTSWDLVNFTTSAPSTHWQPVNLTLRTTAGKDIPTQVPALRWEAVKAYGESHRTVVQKER